MRLLILAISLSCLIPSNGSSAAATLEIWDANPYKTIDELEGTTLEDVEIGHIYLHTSSIAGTHRTKDPAKKLELTGTFYAVALGAKERLPAEEVAGVSFVATLEQNGFAPPLTRDDFNEKVRLPWWPLAPGCRLKGHRFGLKGKEAELLFLLTKRDGSLKWEVTDASLFERVTTFAYGGWGSQIGWKIEKDGKFTVLPRVTSDPTKVEWEVADTAPKAGTIYEEYNANFSDFTYVVSLSENGSSRLWRMGPGTQVAKSYFGNKGPEANETLKLDVVNGGWAWKPSIDKNYRFVDADREKNYVFVSGKWKILERYPSVVSHSFPASASKPRRYQFGPPTGFGSDFPFHSGYSEYLFYLKHQNEYPMFGPPTGMSFRGYYEWIHRNDSR